MYMIIDIYGIQKVFEYVVLCEKFMELYLQKGVNIFKYTI